jgi:Protein of unknown function (DUF4058)
MPLRDHFRPPLGPQRSWEGFHSKWANAIVDHLNGAVLPRRCFAEPHTRLGVQVEVDVVTYESLDDPGAPNGNGMEGGGVATAVEVWAPPRPPITATVDFSEPDLFEVCVYYESGGRRVVAAIELVSPSNKDRPATRRTFAAKCASYLAQGVSVVTVDVVTTRTANLHEELVEVLDLPDAVRWESPTDLSAVAYRTVAAGKEVRLEVWPYPLALGSELPTVPLWIASDLAVPLELERTYSAALASLRIH